jgi:hypothetical protein
MFVLKVVTLLSGGGLALGQIDPVGIGAKLGAMGPSAILGVVCVVSMLINWRLYRDKSIEMQETLKAKDKYSEKLITLIEASTKTTQAQTDAMIEVKNAVSRCRQRGD